MSVRPSIRQLWCQSASSPKCKCTRQGRRKVWNLGGGGGGEGCGGNNLSPMVEIRLPNLSKSVPFPPGTQGFDRPARVRTPVATKAQLKAKISGLFSSLNFRQFSKFKYQTTYLLQVRTNTISKLHTNAWKILSKSEKRLLKSLKIGSKLEAVGDF